MNLMYSKNNFLYANTNLVIDIPTSYEKDGFAENNGDTYETLGILFINEGENNKPKLLTIPTRIHLDVYSYETRVITVNGEAIEVLSLSYLKDQRIMSESVEQNRLVAEQFINAILAGKLPSVIPYDNLLEVWWNNIEMAGASFKVPSKVLEIILSVIYRDKDNPSRRFGQAYGTGKVSPYAYDAKNVRGVVEGLSTFSALIFEDIYKMITTGMNNTALGVEEDVSPLEKIMSY